MLACMRLRGFALQRTQRQSHRLVSSPSSLPPDKPQPAYDKDGKPLPSIPVATTLFKMSNPELMLDPNKRASWRIVAGVVAFFGCYMTYTAYQEGLLTGDGGAQQQAAESRFNADVQKVLPDGRLLMRDGSIVRPPPK